MPLTRMRPAPAVFAPQNADRPMMPGPRITTSLPRMSPSRCVACRPQARGSESTASRWDTPSGMRNSRAASTHTYSANAPSVLTPRKPSLLHTLKRPLRQASQLPQVRLPLAVTRSPTDQPATPAPSCAITPENSWPSVSGAVRPVRRCGRETGMKFGPSYSWRSVPQIPAQLTLIFTYPGCGTGSATSSIRMSLYPCHTAALMGHLRCKFVCIILNRPDGPASAMHPAKAPRRAPPERRGPRSSGRTGGTGAAPSSRSAR